MNNESREIENFLLDEMEVEDRNNFEERIFDDDYLFFELCDTENTLVDRYANGTLKHTSAARLENAMKNSPSLALKFANARTLRDYIRSERDSIKIDVTGQSSLWDRVSSLFTFSSVPSLAFGIVFLILATAFVVLLVQNGHRNIEIARLEAELSNKARSTGREMDLGREITDLHTRETQLQGQIDEERDISGDLTSDLAREREYRRRLERDIASMRKSVEPETPPRGETVSILKLDANSSSDAAAPQLNSEGGPERVSLLISLPATVPLHERVSIRLNGREITRNLAVRKNGAAGSQVIAVIYTHQLAAGQNVVTVHDAAGNELKSYRINGGRGN